MGRAYSDLTAEVVGVAPEVEPPRWRVGIARQYGLELSEMPESRTDSLCCGGGGGRVWMETPKAERFSDLRIDQALGVGAEVLATSCPYCITMLEDSRTTMDAAEKIEVKDLTEIVQELI